MTTKFTISNILIAIAAIFTFVATTDDSYYRYGMNTFFLDQWNYGVYIMQFFTSQFLHGNMLHLIMNSLFIIIFWSVVEQILWEKKYMLFFIFSAVFIGISITLFASWNTIGMSGFAMAVLSFYTLQLKSLKNPEYKWGITALLLNIWIGFAPGISLVWHLFWAISGAVFFFILRILKK